MALRPPRAGLISALAAMLLWALAATGAGAQPAGYDSMDGCDSSWTRQFGIDVLILDCKPGFATDHDRAYMYSRHAVDTAADWRSQASFDDAVWIFDAGARGKASLIVDFHRDGQAVVADFYDDVNGDGEVRYGFERGLPRSVETRFTSMQVRAPDGWWERDGKVNYNLHIEVDGQITAAFHSEVFIEDVRTDGHVDVVTDVHDPDGRGRPKWQIVQAQPDVPDSSAIFRTLLMVNEADDELIPSTYILWPYLGYAGKAREPLPDSARQPLSRIPGASYGTVKNYNEAHPPIQVDWENARVDTVGEFVASRGRAHNWFVYSLIRFGEGSGRKAADFENPFAFYDLAGANDGYPDLVIRNEHYTINDPYLPAGWFGPFDQIRYSWDQEHEHKWSYKLDLFGRRPMPSTVKVGDIEVQTVAYQDYPSWVMDNPWDAVDLVAMENRAYWTTEGIYHRCDTCAADPYYFGQSPVKPVERFAGLDLGMRGEYVSKLGEAPTVYLSAIDRKLHLVRAESGSWRVSEREEVRYASSGGRYLDRWEHLLDGAVAESLSVPADRVIYADPGGVQIARGPAAPALFVSRPPTNGDEWRTLREQLRAARPRGQGSDLQAIFAEFPDERVALPGARVWDIREAEGGFEGLIWLPAGRADDPITRGLDEGTYVLTYQGGRIALRPAEPPRVVGSRLGIRGEAPTELIPSRLAVELRNEGDEDARDLPVAFLAARGGQAGQVVAWTRASVPARESVLAEVTWIPGAPGPWELSATVLGPFGDAATAATAAVAPAPSTDPGSILIAQGLRPFASGAISASLTLVVAIAAGLGFALWRPVSPRSGRDT